MKEGRETFETRAGKSPPSSGRITKLTKYMLEAERKFPLQTRQLTLDET